MKAWESIVLIFSGKKRSGLYSFKHIEGVINQIWNEINWTGNVIKQLWKNGADPTHHMVIINSRNVLAPVRCQSIQSTSDDLSLTWPAGTNFIKSYTFCLEQ